MNPGGEAREVLAFWFGEPGSATHGKARPEWFRKDVGFDAEIRRRFLALHAAAALGERERWKDEPDSLLALILVLDQFSRNLYRDDPRAFSQDPDALACARLMLERGWDAARLPVERQFAYLPFEHSEDMADQDRSVALFASLEYWNGGFVYNTKRNCVAMLKKFPQKKHGINIDVDG